MRVLSRALVVTVWAVTTIGGFAPGATSIRMQFRVGGFRVRRSGIRHSPGRRVKSTPRDSAVPRLRCIITGGRLEVIVAARSA